MLILKCVMITNYNLHVQVCVLPLFTHNPSSLGLPSVWLPTNTVTEFQEVRLSVEPLAPELELRKLQSSDKLLSADFLFCLNITSYSYLWKFRLSF